MSLLFTFLFTSLAYASDATVVALHGSAVSVTAGTETALKLGAKLKNGDTLKTGADSMVVLLFADGTRLKFKDKSEAKIEGESKAPGPSGVNLAAGALFALIPKQDKPHFEVRTRAAVAGVRGTEFFASTGAHDAFWLCVEDGAVNVTPSGSDKPLVVPKGLGVLVEAGKTPEPPKPYAWTKKLNWNMDPDKGDVTDHTDIGSEYKSLLHNKYD
jgi:hypothetical protein